MIKQLLYIWKNADMGVIFVCVKCILYKLFMLDMYVIDDCNITVMLVIYTITFIACKLPVDRCHSV